MGRAAPGVVVSMKSSWLWWGPYPSPGGPFSWSALETQTVMWNYCAKWATSLENLNLILPLYVIGFLQLYPYSVLLWMMIKQLTKSFCIFVASLFRKRLFSVLQIIPVICLSMLELTLTYPALRDRITYFSTSVIVVLFSWALHSLPSGNWIFL